jgi:hypothetical protein
MIRKLALAGMASLVLAGLAWAANAPTYKDPVGQTRDAAGVVLIGTDGQPYDATGGTGGGGGAVTEADGANVTLGAKADAKSTATDTTAITLMSVAKQISASIQAVATSVAGAQPAGTAIIGKVGIDQTTPGTTNGVQVNAALPVGANVIGGVTQADGASVTLGAKADAKSTATDTTAITLMSVAKQISASIQAAAASLAAALPAGEAHLGEVGNNEITLTSAITSTVVTYTTSQSIGGLLTITNAARVSSTAGAPGTSGLIQKAVLGSSVTNTVQVDVVWFNANPTGSTCTNAVAYSLAAADRSKVIGFTHITDWMASGAAYSGQSQNLAMPYALTSATSIYACVVARGSIVGASTSDFTLDTGVIRN